MPRNKNALAAGTFIIFSIILVFVVFAAIKGVGGLFKPMSERIVTFNLADDISGLNVGDDVRVGGYKVGEVKSIQTSDIISDTDQPRILITFSLPKKYVLRQEAHVRLGSSLTGTAWLNIESLGNGKPLDEKAAIQGLPSPYSETFTNANDLIAKSRDLISDTSPNVKLALANIKDLSGTFKDKFPGLLDRVDGFITRVDKVVESASGTVDDIKAASADIKQMSATAKGILTGNRTKLDGIVASLKETSDNLKNASAEIRRSPWRLLYKPGPDEAGNLNLFDAAREFAEGASDLNQAAGALRDAAATKQSDPRQIQQLLDQLDASFKRFTGVEQKFWQSVKE